MPRNRTRERAFPVGLFIILGLVVLVGGVFWIRNITKKPAFTFYAAYKDPSRVQAGVPVYFRGVQVGRVDDVDLSKDQEYAMVHIAITRDDVNLPKDAEIKIQLEGITGQRYVNIKPNDSAAELAYIKEGDVIMGKSDVTLEKLQEQLARIADNRTIEKILTKADQTLTELTSTSRQLNNFVANNQAAASQAIRQFNRTTVAIEGAANNFSGVSGEARVAIQTFNQQMAGADEAFAAVADAGQSISGATNEVRSQLNDSQLLSNLSNAASELTGGVRSIREDVSGASGAFQSTTAELRGLPPQSPANVQDVNELLESMDRAGRMLEDNLKDIRKRNGDPALDGSLDQLQSLARGIRTTAESGRLDPAKASPAEIRAQLQLLQTIGQRINDSTRQLEPSLNTRLTQLPQDDKRRQATGNLLETVQSLNIIGQSLSDKSAQLIPATDARASVAGTPRLGGIAATLVQIRQTAARFDCVARQASDLLDQRFLGFKLFFGKAGKDKYQCSQFDAFQR